MRISIITLSVVSLLSAAACTKNDVCSDEYPCTNGGNGGGGNGGNGGRPDAAPIVDAPVTMADAGPRNINGRVCLISDLSEPFTCATTGADGIIVSLGASEAATAADGSFSIVVPQGNVGSFEVKRTDLTRCLTPFFGGNPAFMTVISTEVYRNFLFNNGIVIAATTGSLLVQVRSNNMITAGATVSLNPATTAPPYEPRYDSGSTIWNFSFTGTKGMAIMAGLAVGDAKIIVRGRAIEQIPIVAGALTSISVETGP